MVSVVRVVSAFSPSAPVCATERTSSAGEPSFQ